MEPIDVIEVVVREPFSLSTFPKKSQLRFQNLMILYKLIEVYI